MIRNPIKWNDWKIKNLIIIVLSLQCFLWGLLLLESYGIKIPILRELCGFIYIAFVPGVLILRVSRLHKLSTVETVLYSVGLSLALSMFIGFFISFLYPIIGIDKPLSPIPIMVTLGIVISSLCVLSYKLDENFFETEKIDIKDYLNNKTLFLFLIPFLSIFGSYFINYYNNNLITIFLLIIIGLIILLAGFNKIPTKLYPLTILVLSLSLLFHNSLISNYIGGFDIQREYFVANSILINFKYELIFPPNLVFFTDANSLLSITTLPAMIYHVCGIKLVWIFKVIYPLLFILVPLGLYRLFKDQTNSNVAFFACIYFITSYSFFYNMIQLMREIIGEIFLVAILLLIFNKVIDVNKKSLLMVIFLFSLAVSHYGLAYIFLAIIIGFYVLQYITNWLKGYRNYQITLNYVLLFITFVLAWYIYNSNSSVFISIVTIFDNIINAFMSDFFNPDLIQGYSIIVSKNTYLNTLAKYIYLVSQFLIIVGILGFIFKFSDKFNKIFKFRDIFDEMNIDNGFYFFACVNVFLLISCIILPYFALSLDTVRIIQIAIIVLSPFMVMGFLIIIKMINNFINKNYNFYPYKLISIFLVIFLFFNVGLVQEAFQEPYKPTMAFKSVNDPPIFNEEEIGSAKWITQNANCSYIYGDSNSFVFLNSFVGPKSRQFLFSIDQQSFLPLKSNSCIYLRTNNFIDGRILVPHASKYSRGSERFINTTSLKNILLNKNKVYDDGSVVYL
jgi:uncharacterized membrane protein